MEAVMRIWRMVGVLLVVLSVGVPVDMFACGDKLLMAGRFTRYQRPKNARAASVLIYAAPASALAATIKKEKIETLLKLEGHRVNTVQTRQDLSTIVTTGRFDVILTANGDSANVQALLAAPDAPVVLGIDDMVKNLSLFETIDKAVVLRDQNLKKTVKR
jgi:hypothetical protein